MTPCPRDDADACDANVLANQLVQFVRRGLEEFATHAAPGLTLPGSYGGHAIGDDTRADLLYVMGLLHQSGVGEAAGVDLQSQAIRLLDDVNPARVEGFYSYRIAETVLRLGGLAALPTDRSVTALVAARSPKLVAALLTLSPKLRTNYLVVGARCLWARAGLEGREPVELPPILRRVAELFTSSASGWIDDGLQAWSQYDIYSPDMYLLAEPFAARLESGWPAGFEKVIDDLDVLAQPRGSIVWGRSVGALSLAMTIEVGAACAQHALGRSPERWLRRIRAAIAQLDAWFSAGVITAHQGRTSDAYRASPRRLQMTLDIYGKLLLAAWALRQCPAGLADRTSSAAWPMTDRLVSFDQRSCSAAWAYRSRSLSFVLPVMHGYSPDYLASPRQPGVFEQPVAGPPTMIPVLFPQVPAAAQPGPALLVPAGQARTVQHRDAGLDVEYDGWAPIGAEPDDPRVIAGGRLASYRVHGRTLEVHERLSFGPGASGTVVLMAGDSADQPVRLSAAPPGMRLEIDTTGLAEWRSHWGASSRVQQVEFRCGPAVEFTWRLTRGLRIASTDLHHQYSEALYGPMAGTAAVVSAGEPDEDLTNRLRDVDILHLAWPERWSGVDPVVTARVIGQVRAAGVQIAWTQHNLIPHRRKDAAGFATYAQWAKAADLMVHHSEYGQAAAQAVYEYGPHTRHVVIPHGEWSEHYRPYRSVSRSEIEREEGWPPARLRLAIIGQPRAEKGIQEVLDAVTACTRDDIQLVARAAPGTTSLDSRIIVEYGHLPERRFHRRMMAFDGVILPFFAEGMLATGTVFDCIGAGVAAITSDWKYLSEVLDGAGIRFGSTAADLTRCLDGLTEEMLERSRHALVALRDRYRWADVAQTTLATFEEL
jgi:glycosyltransferase involved in cell wall biosynthesis